MSNEQNKPVKRSQTKAKPKGWQDTKSPAPTSTPKAKPDLAPKIEAKSPPPPLQFAPKVGLDMLDLWNTATSYGRVSLYTSSGCATGNIFCRIEMLNAGGVCINATSDYCQDPMGALADAIQKARTVRGISVTGAGQ